MSLCVFPWVNSPHSWYKQSLKQKRKTLFFFYLQKLIVNLQVKIPLTRIMSFFLVLRNCEQKTFHLICLLFPLSPTVWFCLVSLTKTHTTSPHQLFSPSLCSVSLRACDSTEAAHKLCWDCCWLSENLAVSHIVHNI